MRIRSRTIRVLAAATLVAGALTAATSATATAAATSCYGSARTISATDPNGRWPVTGYAYATSNCNDINVKSTKQDMVQTCFLPSSGGTSCNGLRPIYANTWALAATDVKDGTKFYLVFGSGNGKGLVAY
ncbi:hypothetical protein [Streptomyces sp. NPDC002133]|uniref:hypothetical protein n=1 Tax=Streptomyces sp. NPDC002133 TaxID=3154409 RepID=UPI00331F5B8B